MPLKDIKIQNKFIVFLNKKREEGKD